MSKEVDEYRKRRQARLDAKAAATRETINAYRKRRWNRLDARGFSFEEKLAITMRNDGISKFATDAKNNGNRGKEVLSKTWKSGIIRKGKTDRRDADDDDIIYRTAANGNKYAINAAKGTIVGGLGPDLEGKKVNNAQENKEKETSSNQAKVYATSERPVSNSLYATGIEQEEADQRWSTFHQEVDAAVLAGKFDGIRSTNAEEQKGYWLGELERSMTYTVEYDSEENLKTFARTLQDTYQQDSVMVIAEGEGATQHTFNISSQDAAVKALKECDVLGATVYKDRIEIFTFDDEGEETVKAFEFKVEQDKIGMKSTTKSVSALFADDDMESSYINESARPREKYPQDRVTYPIDE